MPFRKLASIAATGILGATLGLAVPTAAQASHTCRSPGVTNNGDGYGIMKGGYNLKVAPYSDCGNVAFLGKGTKLYFWCLSFNEYGTPWMYGRVAGTSTYGWMSIENFSSMTGNRGICP
ncbi:hypothetical protein [Micromonospora zhanjiangensis]|uniref:SH3 domain-containing protein n=1 Tax=Micromonospora zhanjiangensis TaxID=1522057 RepID=A0ABV8KIS7_9ACTN